MQGAILRLIAYVAHEARGLDGERAVTLTYGADNVREMVMAARREMEDLRSAAYEPYCKECGEVFSGEDLKCPVCGTDRAL